MGKHLRFQIKKRGHAKRAAAQGHPTENGIVFVDLFAGAGGEGKTLCFF